MPAVIFDLDGLLADTEPLHAEAEKQALASVGIAFRPEPGFRGMTDDLFFGTLLARANRKASLESLIAVKNKTLIRLVEASAVPMQGAVPCVEQLAGRFPLGLASSSQPQVVDAILRKIGLDRRLTVRVTAEDVSEGKPSPEPYQKAADKLGIPPAECVAVEDSRNGLLSAKRAGMKCVCVPDPRYRQNLAGADAVVPSLADVTPELILRLCDGG